MEENKIGKILFNHVSLILAIIGATLSAFIFLTNQPAENRLEIERLRAKIEAHETIGMQLNNIKDNDLHELQRKTDLMIENQTKILERVARMEAILEKK